MAATLAPVLVMLFRRVTRWLPLSAAPMTEWEVLREWDWRVMDMPPDNELDIDGRWVRGRDVCWISCRENGPVSKAAPSLRGNQTRRHWV